MKRSQANLTATSRKRSEKGFQMVEFLVSCTLLSYFLGQMMDGLARVHTSATSVQNQQIATFMAQELFDAARNQRFSVLQSAADSAWHDVTINDTGNGLVAGQPAYLPRPLMLDLSSDSGFNYSPAGKSNLFPGKCQQQLVDNGDGTLTQTVRVLWSEGGTQQRNLSMSTVISQWGNHVR